jgi:hypothetical protein
MATPDPGTAGLDPVHILAICTEAAGGGSERPVYTVAAPGRVRVCMASRRAAKVGCAALARVGYQVDTAGSGRRSGRDVLVTGWSADGLESRLAAMRGVLHRLAGSPTVTARAVIERFRSLPGEPTSLNDGPDLLDQARAHLRAWVAARSGIHAPRNPAVLPADTGNVLRLRAVRVLEQAIDDLIERHLRVAGHALGLFSSLRLQMNGASAKQVAIRRAGIAFHLSSSTARDTSSLLHAGQMPGPDAPPGPPAAQYSRAGSGQRALRDLPAAASGAGGTASPAGPAPSRPGGRSFPGGRPGPSRAPHRP